MEGEETVVGAGAMARQNLQQRLLDAVKQCQIHFGARQELATETDLRVATLCVEWEAVLVHGMKRAKNKPPLKQFAGLGKSEVSLWPLAQLCLSPEESQRFLHLANLRSDVGRGRAWLRAAINERTLETYLHLILASSRLESLYEPHAFLLDQEKSSMLPVMAAGLGSILFSISLDSDSLNTPTRNLDTSLVATPLSSGPTSKLLNVQPNQNGHVAESVVKKKKRKKPSGHASSLPAKIDRETNQEEGVADTEERGVVLLPGGVSPDNLSSSPSLASFGDDLEPPRYVALDTMLGNHSSSEAEAEAAVTATAMVLSATLSSPSLPRPHPQASPPASSSSHTLSPDELREALLAMVKTKDDLEETNKQLEGELRKVREERDRLLTELTQSQTQLTSLQSTRLPQQALERENDILKEQLKMMVQRRDSLKFTDSTPTPGDSTIENSTTYGDEELLSSGTLATRPRPPSHAQSDNKLSEMADMHGELLELNDRLQRDLALKDHYITRLINTIQEAGLQVPTVSRTQSPPPSLTRGSQEIVSVWIPSVIKKGRGPDAHHIYQVFVRIQDQEWNVYRRYAEFREFHKQLQQCIPEIASFHFPPKKALGNKSAQLVEERRQKLQDYLRVVMRLCTEPRTVQGKRRLHQLEPIMKRDIDRDTLQDILPFFKEDMHSSIPPVSQSHRLSYSGL